jgi:GMP synthase-like glutamine amidotransferase
MNPVLILQHMHHDGPAYLARWLTDMRMPFEVRNAAAGQAFPDDMAGYGGLAVLGGAMSANDPLPFLRDAERLILQSMQEDIPVIGHCLGGQLMARALGARVKTSPAPEIGWQALQVLDDPVAAQWFGPEANLHVMHWHHECFELPVGARWLATSPACPHQAFSLGPHLAMQFHVEIDESKLQHWLDMGDPGWAAALAQHADSVQNKATILLQAQGLLHRHQRLADRLYRRWLFGTARLSAS